MNPTRLGIGLAIGAVVVAGGIIGIVLAVNGDGTPAASNASNVCAIKGQSLPCFNAADQWVDATGSVEPSSTTYHYTAPAAATTYAPPPIQKGDFTISLKTTRKQCFGSAGCNVEVQPDISYKGSADQMAAYGTCDIIYSISGDESGDVVATAYGQGGLQFRISSSMISTKSSKVQPAATVTDVTCR
jgi:hypothetical protein